MKNKTKVAVLGDGGWGTTLAILLHSKGYRVSVWGPFADYIQTLERKRENPKFLPGVKIPKEIIFSADISQALKEVFLIVLAVPSHFLRTVLLQLKDCDLSQAIILSAVKGIENSTLLRMSEVITDVLGKTKSAVLSGPTISFEVARGIPTTCIVSSADMNMAEQVQEALISECFRVYTNNDIIGVELGGALKNVIAIACGISDGLNFGANTKAAILTRGLVEISRLGVAMGAKPETFFGLSGLGDLVTTCVSSHGRNRWIGEQIGQGKKLEQILAKMEMVAEGVRTTKSVLGLARKFNIEMPITSEVFAVLFQDKDPQLAVKELMLRKRKPES